MESNNRIVRIEQIEALLDFVQQFPDLAVSHFGRTVEGRITAKRLWSQCAEIVNTVSPGCPRKTPKDWRIFFNEYKSKLLKKIRVKENQKSGAGQIGKIELSPLQKRLYDIIAQNTREPLADVCQHSLFDDANDSKSQNEQPQSYAIESPDSQSAESSQNNADITSQSQHTSDSDSKSNFKGSLNKSKRIKVEEEILIKPSETFGSIPVTTENEISSCNRSATSPSIDTDQMYANFIASKFRSYSQCTRNHLQHQISNLLFQADNGHFDTNHEGHDSSQENSMCNPLLDKSVALRTQWPHSPSSHQDERNKDKDPFNENHLRIIKSE